MGSAEGGVLCVVAVVPLLVVCVLVCCDQAVDVNKPASAIMIKLFIPNSSNDFREGFIAL